MKNWRSILVGPSTSILQAIEIIDKGALQIALVVNENNQLLGTITDGDVRRGILKGIPLQSAVTEIMNPRPIVANSNEAKKKILSRLRLNRLHQIPVLDENGAVVGIEYLDNLIEHQPYDNVIVLMAGGLGTRLKPLTDTIPKPLLKVGSKPILETILENFIEYGFHNFYLSVNYKADMIEEYFGDGERFGVQIKYLHENKRLGTAGALSLLMDKLNEINKPVIVMNGDILTKVNFQQLLDFHKNTQAKATMCVREYSYQIPYGVVKVNKHRLLDIVEKPTSSNFVNAGIYVLEPNVLEVIPHNKFYDMPSLFEALIKQGLETAAFPIREYWLDIGQYDDFNRANGEYDEVFK